MEQSPLEKDLRLIRNVIILAHVDHGKTTLTDSLLAYEGLISVRQAGQLRYLDSRADEQERGITMKSSAVILHYKPIHPSRLYSSQIVSLSLLETSPVNSEYSLKSPLTTEIKNTTLENENYCNKTFTIHLIDSPGHVDFYGQVYCGAKLSDGCCILIDVVEGICSQTIASLRLAYQLGLKPLLFFNKIDRLIVELAMTSLEIERLLWKWFEQVNAFCGHFRKSSQDIHQNSHEYHQSEQKVSSQGDNETNDAFYFDPRKGNIIFGSAIDGWAFRLNLFANLYAKKFHLAPVSLIRALWGPCSIKSIMNPLGNKEYSIQKIFSSNNSEKGPSSLFCQLILENIRTIYHSTVIQFDEGKLRKINQVLGLTFTDKEYQMKDKRILLRTIMKSWIPLSPVLFESFIDTLPSPVSFSAEKYETMFCENSPLKNIMANSPFLSSSNVSLGYMAKWIPEDDGSSLSVSESPNSASGIGMCRLYFGTINVGDIIYFLYPENLSFFIEQSSVDAFQDIPDHNELVTSDSLDAKFMHRFEKMSITDIIKTYPSKEGFKLKEFQVKKLVLLSGTDFKPVNSVTTGHLFGLAGLSKELQFIKSGTFYCFHKPLTEESALKGSSNMLTDRSRPFNNKIDQVETFCLEPLFPNCNLLAPPLLKISIEPRKLVHLSLLQKALLYLYRHDPSVEIEFTEGGEYILAACGELHLEQLVKDLKEKWIPLACIEAQEKDDETEQASPTLPSGSSCVNSTSGKKKVLDFEITVSPPIVPWRETISRNLAHPISLATTYCRSIMEIASKKTSMPGRLLIRDTFYDPMLNEQILLEFDVLAKGRLVEESATAEEEKINESYVLVQEMESCRFIYCDEKVVLDSSISYFLRSGFSLAVAHGPLCAEPLAHVDFYLYSLKAFQIDADDDISFAAESISKGSSIGIPKSGGLISIIKNVLYRAFLEWSPRLMMAYHRVEIHTPTETLGKVYALINQSHGKVISEEYRDETAYFLTTALIPMLDCFGFADDLRSKTSGAAFPMVQFHGFQVLKDEDPFWIPYTVEEMEEYGAQLSETSMAFSYLQEIRYKKGLFVMDELVEHGEKQRTLKR